MQGKAIYLTAKEIRLINLIFDYGNSSFEGAEDEEEKEKLRESILKKTGGTIMLYDYKVVGEEAQ